MSELYEEIMSGLQEALAIEKGRRSPRASFVCRTILEACAEN